MYSRCCSIRIILQTAWIFSLAKPIPVIDIESGRGRKKWGLFSRAFSLSMNILCKLIAWVFLRQGPPESYGIRKYLVYFTPSLTAKFIIIIYKNGRCIKLLFFPDVDWKPNSMVKLILWYLGKLQNLPNTYI